jgi:DNA-binding response OmpR family regulator
VLSSVVGEGIVVDLQTPTAGGPARERRVLPEDFTMDRSSCSVLAIEDDPAFLDLLRVIVEGDFGATLVVARDGQEGLDLAATLHPNLILLDVVLPKLDGVSVCKSLKGSATTRAIPVIGLTAAPWEAARRNMEEAGADGFVHKVYAFHELLPLLVRHLAEGPSSRVTPN